MNLLSDRERTFAEALSKTVYCNPFLPERIQHEREALGSDFVERGSVWNIRHEPYQEHPNLLKLQDRAEELASAIRDRVAADARPSSNEVGLYADLIVYLLYYRNLSPFLEYIETPPDRRSSFDLRPHYEKMAADLEDFWKASKANLPKIDDPAHLFALFFQIRRAFYYIFSNIVGGSLPIARLRAAAWQSIFTHDLNRYRRTLHAKMGDVATLIVGPSGTGKELVARAVALSRYVPFDPKKCRFVEDFAESFHALNISALSPTLIESELFGHRRGSFTGAVDDRAGWLEICHPFGTVFLDEVGDIEPAIQVKLLRVLHTRTFQRLGDTRTLRFQGKIIAATNRDLAREIQAGRFRQDFYYRLCSDMIRTPSLREQLDDAPEEIESLVLFIARRVAADEAEDVAADVMACIDRDLGEEYGWPGNFRELEQCVRNVMIRGCYTPQRPAPEAADLDVAGALVTGDLTADQLLCRYCTHVFHKTGSYAETARRLGLDRRTVKSKIDADLLERLRARKESS